MSVSKPICERAVLYLMKRKMWGQYLKLHTISIAATMIKIVYSED